MDPLKEKARPGADRAGLKGNTTERPNVASPSGAPDNRPASLAPAGSCTHYFIGVVRGVGIEMLSRGVDDCAVAFQQLPWLLRREPLARVFKKTVLLSIVPGRP